MYSTDWISTDSLFLAPNLWTTSAIRTSSLCLGATLSPPFAASTKAVTVSTYDNIIFHRGEDHIFSETYLTTSPTLNWKMSKLITSRGFYLTSYRFFVWIGERYLYLSVLFNSDLSTLLISTPTKKVIGAPLSSK